MNAQQRYNRKRKVYNWRAWDRNLVDIIEEYKKKKNIQTDQGFIDNVMADWIDKNLEYSYKLKG